MDSRRAAAAGLLLGAVAGLAGGLGWARCEGPPPDESPPARTLGPDAALQAERERLEAEVARLSAERDALEQALSESETMLAEAGSQQPESEEETDPEQARLDALRDAGWLPTEIERLKDAFEAYQMERLYLRNQAQREGWRRSARFRREQRALLDDLRQELGDEDFDAALYAEGHPNRVRVHSLLEDSPAQAAGVQVGDEILRYAGERIFEPIRLVRLTAAGEPGRTVELRVLRNGEELRFFLPRGPLGVRLRPAVRPPFGRP